MPRLRKRRPTTAFNNSWKAERNLHLPRTWPRRLWGAIRQHPRMGGTPSWPIRRCPLVTEPRLKDRPAQGYGAGDITASFPQVPRARDPPSRRLASLPRLRPVPLGPGPARIAPDGSGSLLAIEPDPRTRPNAPGRCRPSRRFDLRRGRRSDHFRGLEVAPVTGATRASRWVLCCVLHAEPTHEPVRPCRVHHEGDPIAHAPQSLRGIPCNRDPVIRILAKQRFEWMGRFDSERRGRQDYS